MDAEALVRPVVEGAGLELVDVTWSGRGRSPLLRITIDRDGGVDLDTISAVSEQVSRRLDLEGFEPGRPYQLEVTTPGLERPLRRPQDFRRVIGQRVRVRTDEGTIEGELRDADDEVLRIAASEGERPVPLTAVAAARTVVDWDEELRRGGR